ncbi:MAG: K+-transporting ATPase A subunit [Gammaproteobacteria bacterium]
MAQATFAPFGQGTGLLIILIFILLLVFAGLFQGNTIRLN